MYDSWSYKPLVENLEEATYNMMAFLGLDEFEIPTYFGAWPACLVASMGISPYGGRFTINRKSKTISFVGVVSEVKNTGQNNKTYYSQKYRELTDLVPKMIDPESKLYARSYNALLSRCRDVIETKSRLTDIPIQRILLLRFYRLQFMDFNFSNE